MPQEWNRVKFVEVVIEKLMRDLCISREVAIKHMASFVKKYIILDEQGYVDEISVNEPERFFTIVANIYAEKLNRGADPQDVHDEIANS